MRKPIFNNGQRLYHKFTVTDYGYEIFDNFVWQNLQLPHKKNHTSIDDNCHYKVMVEE